MCYHFFVARESVSVKDSTIIIDKDIVDAAGQICGEIQPEEKKCRAVSDVFAAKTAAKCFEDEDCDIESGLHNSPSILENIDIADIYVKNSFIDVRLYFNENELCVPKAHFELGILPVAYMFIKIDKSLSQGEVHGFITPSDVDRNTEINGYYRVKEESLIPYYDIEALLNAPNQQVVDLQEEIQIYDFLDGKIENNAEFYRKLIESRELRLALLKADSTKYFIKHLHEGALTSDNEISEPADNFIQKEFSEEFLPMDTNDEDSAFLEEQEEDNLLEVSPADDLISETSDELDGLSENIDESSELDISSDTEPLEINQEEPIHEIEDKSDELSNLYPDKIVNASAEIDTGAIENEIDTSEDANEEIPEYEEPNSDIINQEFSETEQNEDFSTEVTPSLTFIEDEENKDEEKEDIVDQVEKILDTAPDDDNNPQDLDTLFTNNDTEQYVSPEQKEEIEEVIPEKKKTSSLYLKTVLALALIAGVGYFGYTKFGQSQMPAQNTIPKEENTLPADNTKTDDAMPVETIENHNDILTKEEGTSVQVPEIEKNLDASVLISNLAVSWEVPAGYLTNNSAKRYFTKIGKVLQLQLKTELLLSSKPPLNNRIVVELEYDKNANAFNIKGITTSSGEKSIDDIVTKTVNNVLKMNLNINTSAFANIQGNPVLIIKL